MPLSPNHSAPDGSYTLSSHPYDWGQSLDESTVTSIVTGQDVASINNAEAEVDANIKVPITNLTNDVNLLKGVPAYGAAYQSKNIWVINDAPVMPFNAQIGPNKKVDVLHVGTDDDGGLRGYDPGLWVISVHNLADDTPYTGGPWVRLDLHIRAWDDTGTELISYDPIVLQNPGAGEETVAINYSFVIPTGLDHFDCWVNCLSDRWRRFSGGSQLSMMSLRRISTEVANTSHDGSVNDGNEAP